MSTLEAAYGKLLGRQPSDKERQDLYRTRDALRLKDNDALWLLLMALGHYEALYERFPQLIREAAGSTLAEIKQTAEVELKASAEATKKDLAEAVSRASLVVARDAARTPVLRWSVACLMAAVTCLSLVGCWAYRQGAQGGHARGWREAYLKATDEKAAASWANTPEGRAALGLAKAGSIRELASCSGRGWVQKAGVCYPHAEHGSTYGWRLSEGGRGAR